MGIVVKNLSATEIQQAQQQAQAIASAATLAIQPGQFVFFAAFDGTNPPGTPSSGVLPYLNIFNGLGLIPERLSGLTEEDRAARAGQLAPAPTGTSQDFRPVILDLDGDGIQLADKTQSGVAFDVNGSGLFKAMGWLAYEGENTDGHLWLDRSWNSAIDTGGELLSKKPISLTVDLYPTAYLRRNGTFLSGKNGE